MFIYSSISDLKDHKNPPQMFDTYAQLINEIKPDLTWNGYFRDVEIHTEEELENYVLPKPPPGMESRANTEHHNELYCLNKIYPHQREAIPADWEKLRWVVGIHYEKHIRDGEHPQMWDEKCWTVIGVIACKWGEKSEKPS